MTLDGGLVYEAGLHPYKLRPVAAEVYQTRGSEFSLGTRKLGPWPWPWPWPLGSQSGWVAEVGSQTISHLQGVESLGSLRRC